MRTIARVVKLVSDISGEEAAESEFASLIVRDHAAIDSPKQLDILKTEADKFQSMKDLVSFEIKVGDETRELVMPLKDFRALIKDETVKAGASTRGRKLGTSVAPKAS